MVACGLNNLCDLATGLFALRYNEILGLPPFHGFVQELVL